ALPHNPTTEMDLALWELSRRARSDPGAARCLSERSPDALAATYRAGALPAALQQGLQPFLALHGHRAVAEIDIGLPRWSEDSSQLLVVLANYLRLDHETLAPDAQFRRAAAEAEA